MASRVYVSANSTERGDTLFRGSRGRILILKSQRSRPLDRDGNAAVLGSISEPRAFKSVPNTPVTCSIGRSSVGRNQRLSKKKSEFVAVVESFGFTLAHAARMSPGNALSMRRQA